MGNLLFQGRVMSTAMVPLKGLHYLELEALSHTSEWGLFPVSQTFLNLESTYR